MAAERPRLFGAAYSVYVRIARLALIEKGVDHELVPVDIFSPEGIPDWYRERHPFGKIPAFEHGSLRLFETAAIARYVDEAFPGPALQPADVAERAVMNQIVGLLDAYAYRTLVWDIYVEAVSKPREGGATDAAKVAAALPRARTCLETLERLKRPGPWLLGEQLTLADLHAAPMFAYFVQASEGRDMLAEFPGLGGWWEGIRVRDSFMKTNEGD
ncbi:glutathione S-transferase family protein [Aquibium oceanicum]|uniref:glutathione transferase n=1 Tax=Aquibium oceanicum TaxID=1670800 RepID=A0A1L3SU52_9HYPH|nr:glutathione S-transferase family protein [Aquibium oceanicum]APH72929.1 glutathione S-transferase [Aquibium oceanicum]